MIPKWMEKLWLLQMLPFDGKMSTTYYIASYFFTYL